MSAEKQWTVQMSSLSVPTPPGNCPRRARKREKNWAQAGLLGEGALGRGWLSSRTWRSKSLQLERAVSAGLKVTSDFHPR